MDVRCFYILLLHVWFLTACGVGSFVSAPEDILDDEVIHAVEVSSVTMERVSEQTLSVSWSASATPANFYVAIGLEDSIVSCLTPTSILDGNQTETTFSNLEHSTTYKVSVCAVQKNGLVGGEATQTHKTFPQCDVVASGAASFSSFDSFADSMSDSNGDGIYALCLEDGTVVTNTDAACASPITPRSNTFIFANKGATVLFDNQCDNGTNFTVFSASNRTGLSFENLSLTTHVTGSRGFSTATTTIESVVNIQFTGSGTNSRFMYLSGGSVKLIKNVTVTQPSSSIGAIYMLSNANIDLIDGLDVNFTGTGSYAGFYCDASSIQSMRNVYINAKGTSGMNYGIFATNCDFGSISNSEFTVKGVISMVSGIRLTGGSSITSIKDTTFTTSEQYAHGVQLLAGSHVDAMENVFFRRLASTAGNAVALLSSGDSYFVTSAIKNVTACGVDGGSWTFSNGQYLADSASHIGPFTVPTTHTPRGVGVFGSATFPFNDSAGGTAGTDRGITFGGACP